MDGVSILEDLPGWQRSIGMVPQDIYLVDNTIRANIAFGDPADDDSERRLHEAIASAQLTELVDSLPQGVDTETGERGARLSGGQRQRPASPGLSTTTPTYWCSTRRHLRLTPTPSVASPRRSQPSLTR